ncbi:MAG: HIT domain-containing protein, partial [Candidatus Omnitrophica bacterium]|nr:HIT domain-containing protein [Candidatus Omnitrophota bacterium]
MTPRVWAPWRRRYLLAPKGRGCLFCRARRARDDRRHWVVHRTRHAVVMLNLYPYTNGHVLIAPNRHVGRLDRLTDGERVALWQLAGEFTRRLDRALAPHGYNIGANLGRAAGAGVVGHLHLHVVPRWIGDTNFMPVLSDTRVISDSLDAVYH